MSEEYNWRKDFRVKMKWTWVGFAILVALTFLWFGAKEVFGQEQTGGFLAFHDQIPREQIRVNGGMEMAFRLTEVDTFFFGPFILGGSDQLPEDQLILFDSLVASVGEEEYVFFRGTADINKWGGGYAEIESPRLNRSLAQERARWAKDRAGIGDLLVPWINTESGMRGFFFYKASYAQVVPDGSGYITVSDLELALDSVTENYSSALQTMRAQHQEEHDSLTRELEADRGFFYDLYLGGAGGAQSLFADGKGWIIPAVSILFQKGDNWLLAVSGGWIATSGNGFGDTYDAILSAELARYWGHFGIAGGARGAWTNVTVEDDFVERAYGLFVGGRGRYSFNQKMMLIGGVDLQGVNISEVGAGDRWKLGISVSASLAYMLR